jgi:preprotein translocase subunit SecB
MLASGRVGARRENPMAKKKQDETDKTNGDASAPDPTGSTSGRQQPGAAGRAATDAQLAILAQYVKDLSFESPGAPQTLQGPGDNPQLQIGVNVSAGPRGDDVYEVIVHIEAHAKSDAGVIYNCELDYAGLFRIKDVPQHLLQPVMFVDCPTLLFPFVRRVIADMVRDGGFPPLLLDPIDFGRLYSQNLARKPEGSPAQPN